MGWINCAASTAASLARTGLSTLADTARYITSQVVSHPGTSVVATTVLAGTACLAYKGWNWWKGPVHPTKTSHCHPDSTSQKSTQLTDDKHEKHGSSATPSQASAAAIDTQNSPVQSVADTAVTSNEGGTIEGKAAVTSAHCLGTGRSSNVTGFSPSKEPHKQDATAASRSLPGSNDGSEPADTIAELDQKLDGMQALIDRAKKRMAEQNRRGVENLS